MSAYKLIEVSKTTEKETQSIYDKDNKDNAVNTMHNDFGVAVKQSTTIGAYALVIDNETGAKVDGVQWGESVKDRVYTHNNKNADNIAYYDTEQLAVGNYHTKLASQHNDAEITHAITIRLNGIGTYEDYDVYDKN